MNDAVKRLASIRSVPGCSDLIPTGMPRASKHRYGNQVTQSQRELADVREVLIADLHAVQRGVSRRKVRQLLGHPEAFDQHGHTTEHGILDDLPIVVQYGSKLYLHDGHHRVVAQRILGAERVKARVVRIQNPIALWAKQGSAA
jgi:hypothetical protein